MEEDSDRGRRISVYSDIQSPSLFRWFMFVGVAGSEKV